MVASDPCGLFISSPLKHGYKLKKRRLIKLRWKVPSKSLFVFLVAIRTIQLLASYIGTFVWNGSVTLTGGRYKRPLCKIPFFLPKRYEVLFTVVKFSSCSILCHWKKIDFRITKIALEKQLCKYCQCVLSMNSFHPVKNLLKCVNYVVIYEAVYHSLKLFFILLCDARLQHFHILAPGADPGKGTITRALVGVRAVRDHVMACRLQTSEGLSSQPHGPKMQVWTLSPTWPWSFPPVWGHYGCQKRDSCKEKINKQSPGIREWVS